MEELKPVLMKSVPRPDTVSDAEMERAVPTYLGGVCSASSDTYIDFGFEDVIAPPGSFGVDISFPENPNPNPVVQLSWEGVQFITSMKVINVTQTSARVVLYSSNPEDNPGAIHWTIFSRPE